MPRPQLPAPDVAVTEGPSKTRRKLEMHELQDLGVALVALDPKRLATLELPEALVDAITLARKTHRHEARRRQMQYIGRLMRDVDAAPIRTALAAWGEGPKRDRERFAQIERWRDRIIDEADGLEAFVAAYPGAPRDALAALVAAARGERARGAPPAKSRALFRELKRIVENESA
jgi:ribosome-associated protein